MLRLLLFRESIFEDEGIKKALGNYVDILKKRKKAKYLIARQNSSLEAKIKKAEKLVEKCCFCERRCGVNRKKGELGWCKVGYEARVSSAFQHIGEESELIPSGTIFFSGCNFHCVYCQNWDISQYPNSGRVWSPSEIARWIENCGCINVNFVGGEPTPNLHWILKALKECNANIPVIWNSNMYMSEEAMQILDGVVDVYLADFRYGNSECALKYSKVPKYFETVSRNFLLAKKQAEILLRLLVLPGHIECCDKPIIKWIAENLGNDVRINIMSQYRPQYEASKYTEINRRLARDEYCSVVDYAKQLGLWNIEIQGI